MTPTATAEPTTDPTTPDGTMRPESTGAEPHRHRARWAAIGAAIAVSFGAGAASLPIADAVTSSGVRTSYTAITPCRLADFRPDSQVGPRGAPLGSNETETVAARGAQGECAASDLPADAIALQLNVTALGATLPTFLAITPDGSTGTSSLNPVPGAPPTPNAVTVELDADGAFKIFNLQGNVDVIVDVTGFYTDHNHDDRYYTEAEIDDALAAAFASGPSLVEFGPANTFQTLDTLSLPTGNYVVIADVVANSNEEFFEANVNCRLLLGTTVIDSLNDGPGGISLNLDQPGDREAIALSGAHSLDAAGTASLECRAETASGFYESISLTAIKVSSITS